MYFLLLLCSIQHYVIKFVSDFSGYYSFLNQLNWPTRYNWNIVKSSFKHHNPNPTFIMLFPQTLVSSTNKTDRRDIADLKVSSNTIILYLSLSLLLLFFILQRQYSQKQSVINHYVSCTTLLRYWIPSILFNLQMHLLTFLCICCLMQYLVSREII